MKNEFITPEQAGVEFMDAARRQANKLKLAAVRRIVKRAEVYPGLNRGILALLVLACRERLERENA